MLYNVYLFILVTIMTWLLGIFSPIIKLKTEETFLKALLWLMD